MDMQTFTLNMSESEVAIVDEIAENLRLDRAAVLREALLEYLASYAEEKAISEEADHEVEAGISFSHEEVQNLMRERMGKILAA